jgi:hypothetical protein
MANRDAVLTYRQFLRKKNSFQAYFIGEVGGHWAGDIYRDQGAYKACMNVEREFAALAAELRERDDRSSPGYKRRLYRAYLLMHPYAKSDADLFQ